MKILIAMAALTGAMILSMTTVTIVSTPVQAQNDAACRHHLQGYTRITGPAQEAMKKNYQACLKQKKKK